MYAESRIVVFEYYDSIPTSEVRFVNFSRLMGEKSVFIVFVTLCSFTFDTVNSLHLNIYGVCLYDQKFHLILPVFFSFMSFLSLF